ncbi:MAG: M20/M25/M40 family metallo-hydrolase [Planctomycetes bacterium]|nr:M20/M25/M40 family metallo-hydrolase [Planctomycetota bacterium]
MKSERDFGVFELLRKLTEAPGVSGREERIRELVLAETAGMWDETRVDSMGNLICFKAARAKKGGKKVTPPEKVMLACHMDEIGFYVRHIDEKGHVRIQNAGGFDTRNLFSKRVLVQGRKDLVGVLQPGGRPIHISTEEDRKRVPEVKDFYVDLFLPKAEVERNVRVGDPITLLQETYMIGDAICGKAMDNRVALWTGINALRKAGDRLRYDTYFVACVQEEVGLRGAMTAAYGINPDIGVAIDVTLACDTPGVEGHEAITTFGGGAAVKWMDSATISHHGLFEEFISIAKARKIKHQLEVLPRGGTDAGAVQRTRAGTKAITLSIPTRYIHTITEAIHKKDALATVDLLAAWLSA